MKINRNQRLSSSDLLVDESLLSTANGYIGIRGNFEEGYGSIGNGKTIKGTYINAFHEIIDITYGESAHGFPETQQTLLNVIDIQEVKLIIDDEEFNISSGKVINLERNLDMNRGVVTRVIHWISPKGHELVIEIKRMTSFERIELFLMEYKVKSINFNGKIEFVSKVNGCVRNYVDKDDPRVGNHNDRFLQIKAIDTTKETIQMISNTKRSKMEMCVSVGYSEEVEIIEKNEVIEAKNQRTIKTNEEVSFIRYGIFTDNLRHENPKNIGFKKLEECMKVNIENLYKEQKVYLDEFWNNCDIEIKGNDELNEGVKYNLYALLSSVGKEPTSNVAAKGLSGEGYEGHYFWDTEIYMLPFFTCTNPKLAKNLLEFRNRLLDDSKKRAKQMGHTTGAKIPWRTISGSECSSFFPAGSAQYHINGDVAYSNIQYYLMSGDVDYIIDYGYETLVETARIWLDMGHYGRDGKFRIDAVTGPDEYTAIVNNNYYTNSLAKYQMIWIIKFYNMLKGEKKFDEVVSKIGLKKEELEAFKKATKMMYLPYSEELGINLQDDSFINKAVWDFKNTPKENYPLLLNYHPLTIYRHQVCKQADTVLSHFLLDDVDEKTLINSYNYYEKLTTHDSSLSPTIFSIMANRIGHTDKAYEYFKESVRLDLDNTHKNTKDGLHIANSGGVFLSIVYGFGGLRIKEDGISIKPVLPKDWTGYSFILNISDTRVKVEVSDKITITSKEAVKLKVWNESYEINGTVIIEL